MTLLSLGQFSCHAVSPGGRWHGDKPTIEELSSDGEWPQALLAVRPVEGWRKQGNYLNECCF